MSNTERDARGRFPPGVSGNPNGRTKGARNKLGYAFVEALEADFTVHGKEAIEKVRDAKPHEYLKVVASLLPREINYSDTTVQDLTEEQLREGLAAIKHILAIRSGNADGASTPSEDDPAASRH